MPAALLALALLAAPGSPPPAPLRAALEAALALPDARAELVELTGALPPRCALVRAEAPRPVTASGRAALHLSGADEAGEPCDAWVWARVRVSAPTLVTVRAVAEGEPLEGAVAPAEREVAPGRAPLATLPEGARAVRALAPGVPLEAGALRVGPRPGAPVAVLLRAGPLTVEQVGRALACRPDRACALLPSGRRVEGAWHGGRILLESP